MSHEDLVAESLLHGKIADFALPLGDKLSELIWPRQVERQFISFNSLDVVLLDGTFTVEQLEKIIAFMKELPNEFARVHAVEAPRGGD